MTEHRLIDNPRMDDFRDVSCSCGEIGGVMRLLTSANEWFDHHIATVQAKAERTPLEPPVDKVGYIAFQ